MADHPSIPGAWPEATDTVPLPSRIKTIPGEPQHLDQVAEFHRKLRTQASNRSLKSTQIAADKENASIVKPSQARSISGPTRLALSPVPAVRRARASGKTLPIMALYKENSRADSFQSQTPLSRRHSISSSAGDMILLARKGDPCSNGSHSNTDESIISGRSVLSSGPSSSLSWASQSETSLTDPPTVSSIAFGCSGRSISKSPPKPILLTRSVSDCVSDSTAWDTSYDSSENEVRLLLPRMASGTPSPTKIRFKEEQNKASGACTPTRLDAPSFELPPFSLTMSTSLSLPHLSDASTGSSLPGMVPPDFRSSKTVWKVPEENIINPSLERLLQPVSTSNSSVWLTDIVPLSRDLAREESHASEDIALDPDSSATHYAEALMDTSVWHPDEGPASPERLLPLAQYSIESEEFTKSKGILGRIKKFGVSVKSLWHERLHTNLQRCGRRLVSPQAQVNTSPGSDMALASSRPATTTSELQRSPVRLLPPRRPRPSITANTFREQTAIQVETSEPFVSHTISHQGTTMSSSLHRRFPAMTKTKNISEIQSRRRMSMPIIARTQSTRMSDSDTRPPSTIALPSIYDSETPIEPPNPFPENSMSISVSDARALFAPPGLEVLLPPSSRMSSSQTIPTVALYSTVESQMARRNGSEVTKTHRFSVSQHAS